MVNEKPIDSAVDHAIKVQLFLAGNSPSSRRARRAVEALLARSAADRREFEVIDVLRQPERALASNLLATPTLIIDDGQETARYVGDLYEHEDLLELLRVAPSG